MSEPAQERASLHRCLGCATREIGARTLATIRLRRATAEDAPLVHAWRSEPSTSRYQPTLPLSLGEVRAMLAERSATPIGRTAGKFQWLIEAGGEPVGWVTLHVTDDDRRHGNGIVGYTIGERF